MVGTSGKCDNTLPYGIIVGPHAVLWDSDGTPIDLGNLGSVDVTLPGVGDRRDLHQQQRPGSRWIDARRKQDCPCVPMDAGRSHEDLGVLPGDFTSAGLAINSRGEVVGASNDTDGNLRAFIWRNGLMTDLNTLVPADSPLYLLFAAGINERGEIVGFGATPGGDVHAFLATPDNSVAVSKALGVERPDALSEAGSKALPYHFGKASVPATLAGAVCQAGNLLPVSQNCKAPGREAAVGRRKMDRDGLLGGRPKSVKYVNFIKKLSKLQKSEVPGRGSRQTGWNPASRSSRYILSACQFG